MLSETSLFLPMIKYIVSMLGMFFWGDWKRQLWKRVLFRRAEEWSGQQFGIIFQYDNIDASSRHFVCRDKLPLFAFVPIDGILLNSKGQHRTFEINDYSGSQKDHKRDITGVLYLKVISCHIENALNMALNTVACMKYLQSVNKQSCRNVYELQITINESDFDFFLYIIRKSSRGLYMADKSAWNIYIPRN